MSGYDDDDDDFMDDDVAGLNDPNVEHLPEPPMLSARQTMDDTVGDPALEPHGIAVSPLLWAQGAVFPGVTQFRAWRLDNGNHVSIGFIAATCSEEDFIRRFFDNMPTPTEEYREYIIRPVDQAGRDVGHQQRIKIDGNHVYLQALRERRSAHAGPGPIVIDRGPGGDVNPQVMSLLDKALASAAEREARALEEAAQQRNQTYRMMEQGASERVAIAQTAAHSVQEQAKRMLDADAQRHDQHLRSLQQQNEQNVSMQRSFFEGTFGMLREDREAMANRHNQELAAMRARHEQEMEAQRERRRTEADERRMEMQRDQQRFEQRMLEQRQEMERRDRLREEEAKERRAREEREFAFREQERARAHEMALAQMKADREADREHQRAMHDLALKQFALQQGGSGSLEATLIKGLALAEKLGIDVKDIGSKLLGGGAETGNSDAVYQLIGTVIEQAGGVVSNLVASRAAAAAAQGASRQIASFDDVTEDWIDEDDESVGALQPAAPPVQVNPAPQQPAPAASAPTQTVTLAEQKAARSTLRALVTQIGGVTPIERQTLIMQVVSDDLAVRKYLGAIGVHAAFSEAGVQEPAVFAAIVAALKNLSFTFPE